MKRFIGCLLLLIPGWGLSLGKVPYNQLVFPEDVNRYPLIFTPPPLNCPADLKAEYDQATALFFAEQERIWGVKHKNKLLTQIDPTDTTYKYVVKTRLADFTTASSAGTYGNQYMYTENHLTLTFWFEDLRENKKFREFALAPLGRSNEDYEERNQPTFTNQSRFFEDLSRIIANLNQHGADKTFEIEKRKQHRRVVPVKIIKSAGIVGLPVGLLVAAIIQDISQ